MLPFSTIELFCSLKKKGSNRPQTGGQYFFFRSRFWGDPPTAHSVAAELYIMKHVFPRSIPGSLWLLFLYEAGALICQLETLLNLFIFCQLSVKVQTSSKPCIGLKLHGNKDDIRGMCVVSIRDQCSMIHFKDDKIKTSYVILRRCDHHIDYRQRGTTKN